MSVPTTNTLNDRVNELEAIVYGAPVIGGSPPNGVVVTSPASGAGQAVSGPLTTTAVTASGTVQGATLAGSQQESVVNLSGSTDALPLLGSAFVTSSGVDAMTLGTPTAGGPGVGNDGNLLTVQDTGGHAHTITTAANKIVPSHHILTFSGTAGAFVTLQAFNGLWYVQGSSGVTPS